MSLKVFSNYREEVLAKHGKTEESLEEDKEILKKWIEQEPHLPRTLLEEINFLEIFLIRNKFSVEKVKSKIENYCTMKEKFRYLMEDYIGKIVPSEEPVFYYPIEILTEGKLERILFGKLYNEEIYDFAKDIATVLMYRELSSRFDYCDSEILVFDYSICSAQFVTKIRINIFANAMNLFFKGHSSRMVEIHFINKWAHLITAFVKPFLPEKLRKRLYCHESIEVFKEKFPKKLLSSDYGGEQKSIEEFKNDWDKIFAENTTLIIDSCNTMSQENLRIDAISSELQGTFRKLCVD